MPRNGNIFGGKKYFQISDRLLERIHSGELAPGAQLPSYRELAEEFKTTQVTISNALRELERDGWVLRRVGKGVFVRLGKGGLSSSAQKNVSTQNQVGLLLAGGDVYGALGEALGQGLKDSGFYTVSLFSGERDSHADFGHWLAKYMDEGFASLVVHGLRDMHYRSLLRKEPLLRQLNFVLHFTSSLDFPQANIIEADFREAGRLAAAHLLKSGKKRIMLQCFHLDPEDELEVLGSRGNSHENEMLQGAKDIFEEAGIDFDDNFCILRHEKAGVSGDSYMDALEKFMSQGPCGVMLMADSSAPDIYRAARKLGLEIGKELGIVGLYNTSWTEILYPSLSSISVKEREIGALTARCIIEAAKGERVKVLPEFVKRNT